MKKLRKAVYIHYIYYLFDIFKQKNGIPVKTKLYEFAQADLGLTFSLGTFSVCQTTLVNSMSFNDQKYNPLKP